MVNIHFDCHRSDKRKKNMTENERKQKSPDLYEQLSAYGVSDFYPFHMPGHKRNFHLLGDPYAIDITEIDGFDNLHHAETVLLEAQRRAARSFPPAAR